MPTSTLDSQFPHTNTNTHTHTQQLVCLRVHNNLPFLIILLAAWINWLLKCIFVNNCWRKGLSYNPISSSFCPVAAGNSSSSGNFDTFAVSDRIGDCVRRSIVGRRLCPLPDNDLNFVCLCVCMYICVFRIIKNGLVVVVVINSNRFGVFVILVSLAFPLVSIFA